LGSRRLGNYELLVRLASGGAAHVFLARELEAARKGRLIALKVLQPSLTLNEDFVQMFFTEARLAARLHHENVVAIAGFGSVEGVHCLALEYVFGASLGDVLRASARAQKPMSVGVLLSLTASVCDALHYAHELADEHGRPMGLVHRDVTPQNILVGFNGIPKLVDFGIAKATGRGWETQAGIVKGKFSYMSPEQALGKPIDRRSDVFGVGIVLWEALTGHDLFKGSMPAEVITSIREQRIEPPSRVVPGLTEIVDPIVLTALQRNPRRRYATAKEMGDHIRALIDRAGVKIDAAAVSRELAAIYGSVIADRALALRGAMSGGNDLEHLARVLGAHPLDDRLLPVLAQRSMTPAGPRPAGDVEASASRPARPERSAHGKPRTPSVPVAADAGPTTDAAPVAPSEWGRPVPRAAPERTPVRRVTRDLPRPFGESEPPPDFTSWEDTTEGDDRDDELLRLLTTEDVTVGKLPEDFRRRFEKAPKELTPPLGRLEVEAPESEDVRDDDTLDDDEPVVTGELAPRSVASWDDDPSDEGLSSLHPTANRSDDLPAADRVTAPAAPGLSLTPAEALAQDEALVDLRPGLRIPTPALIVGALALFALGVGVGLLLSSA
jgi:hypothetical protein